METMMKQLDPEADLRASITEALAVAGAVSRRRPLGGSFLESSVTQAGGPCALFVIGDGTSSAPWRQAVEAVEQISPGGWVWAVRGSGPDEMWIEVEKVFGESDRSMGVALMLSSEVPAVTRDAAAIWADSQPWLTHRYVAFGQEAF